MDYYLKNYTESLNSIKMFGKKSYINVNTELTKKQKMENMRKNIEISFLPKQEEIGWYQKQTVIQ